MTARTALVIRVAAWLRALAALAFTGIAVSHILIIWIGGWPVETAESRISWLGWSLMISQVALILSLFLVGGIRTIRLRGGPVEASINDDTPGDGARQEEGQP